MLKAADINPDVPLIIFTYFNVVLAWGVERFMKDAVEAGITIQAKRWAMQVESDQFDAVLYIVCR